MRDLNHAQGFRRTLSHATCHRYVKDADKAIIARLKADGRIVKVEVEHHSYPFCWRSDTPLIYKVT